MFKLKKYYIRNIVACFEFDGATYHKKHLGPGHIYHCIAFPLLLTTAWELRRPTAGLLREEHSPSLIQC